MVIRSAAIRDADRSVPVPWPRRRGAVSVHTNRQPRLSPLAHQRHQGHSDQGQTLRGWLGFIGLSDNGRYLTPTGPANSLSQWARHVCNVTHRGNRNVKVTSSESAFKVAHRLRLLLKVSKNITERIPTVIIFRFTWKHQSRLRRTLFKPLKM